MANGTKSLPCMALSLNLCNNLYDAIKKAEPNRQRLTIMERDSKIL